LRQKRRAVGGRRIVRPAHGEGGRGCRSGAGAPGSGKPRSHERRGDQSDSRSRNESCARARRRARCRRESGSGPQKNEIEWALKLDEIKNDANGQWANGAKASSAYNDAQGTAGYSASQASGAPNVEGYGSSNSAWTSKTPDAGIEWLELEYAKPVHATGVRVRESNGAGAIIKVEVFDEQGGAHAVWTGADSTQGLNFLIVEFPATAFKTNRVKLTLATNVVPGWSAIDAVQLVGTELR